MQSSFEEFHSLCHHGREFWTNTYQYGRRYLQSSTEGGNHTLHYQIHVYPSDEFQAAYITYQPMMLAAIVALIFIFTSALFVMYDRLVQHRQNQTMRNAEMTSAVVNSLFPPNVRDRLLRDRIAPTSRSREEINSSFSTDRRRDSSKHIRRLLPEPAKMKLKSYLSQADLTARENLDGDPISLSPPIADLFPHTTVVRHYLCGCECALSLLHASSHSFAPNRCLPIFPDSRRGVRSVSQAKSLCYSKLYTGKFSRRRNRSNYSA